MSKAFKAIEPCETLSGRTVNYYHRILSSILSSAEQWEAIESNPCRKIKAPKIRRTPPRYLDEEQAVELVRLVEKEDPKFRMITLLLLLTGMRREEAMGLEWKDPWPSFHSMERPADESPDLHPYKDKPKDFT